jgi:hypothetical protein
VLLHLTLHVARECAAQVAWDKLYTYYRIKVNLAETFADNFTPDPNEAHLIQIVISGDVFDNSTGVKVSHSISRGAACQTR